MSSDAVSQLSAFDYVVRQIRNRSCVPFAGAGISVSSESTVSDWKEESGVKHSVKWMVGEISDKLLKKRKNRYDRSQHGAVCRYCLGIKKDENGNEVSDLSLPSPLKEVLQDCKDEQSIETTNCLFCDVSHATQHQKLGALSEMFVWEFEGEKDAYQELVELLQIKKYADLQPTSAHLYIARLSLEGYIEEVITTNYDCNFEHAFLRLSGKAKDTSGDNVIAELNDYRKTGKYIGDSHKLIVYKVNGCAKKLAKDLSKQRDEKSGYAEKILLTERQLQKWGNRQWAADLFRDRLRSKTLLFVGFGSEEPQVHHTLQTVLDEYGYDVEEKKGDETLNLDSFHNAPIVSLFEPNPSFIQQQITQGFAKQYELPRVFSERMFLRKNASESLSADELWKNIYLRVLQHEIIDCLKRVLQNSDVGFLVSVPNARNEIRALISDFSLAAKENGNGQDDQGMKTVYPEWFVNILSKVVMLDDVCFPGQEDDPVIKFVAFYQAVSAKPEQSYMPINENPLFLAEALLTLKLMRQFSISDKEKILIQKILLSTYSAKVVLDYAAENRSVTKTFQVMSHKGQVDKTLDSTPQYVGSRLTLLIGQEGNIGPPDEASNIQKKNNQILRETIVTLGWEHLFAGKTRRSHAKAEQHLLRAILHPGSVFLQHQAEHTRTPFLKKRVQP